MEALVEIGGELAVIKDWHWESDDPALAKRLNSMLPEWGASPSDPQPEINEARRVVGELGGEVLREIPYPPDPEATADTVY